MNIKEQLSNQVDNISRLSAKLSSAVQSLESLNSHLVNSNTSCETYLIHVIEEAEEDRINTESYNKEYVRFNSIYFD
jgi:hypothetical protein